MSLALQVAGLTKRFGGLTAVEDLSFAVPAGRIYGVIGPNGAGKSTLIGLIGGALRASAGAVRIGERDVTALSACERARLGIARTYQVPRPFLDMSVEENLAVAQSARRHGAAQARAARAAILEQCGLAGLADQPARQLPLLRRKRLEVARALALEPQLLLLDEVGAGLIDAEVTELIGLIQAVAATGVTILIVEHVLRIVRECCERLLVLNFGRALAEGPTRQILASDEVAAVYLGTAGKGAPSPAAPPVDVRALVRASTPDTAAADVPLLALRSASARYGLLPALHDVDLHVRPGEVVGVLGANGAGKTSLANLISGVLPLTGGSVEVDGIPIARLEPTGMAGRGIAHCMEGRRIFADLSVEENLRLAAQGVGAAACAERLAAVYALFPALGERPSAGGTSLSGGQQQMLAIGRALMARPRLVIFDEISLGLAPLVMDRLYAALRMLKEAGLTMVLVEQDVSRALALADRVYVLEHGAVALSGPASAVAADPRLRHLYIGTAD